MASASVPTTGRAALPRSLRCVVLATADDLPSAALLQALAGRGLTAQVVQSAAVLMAELARRNVSIILVNRPARRNDLDRLRAATAKYYPQVVWWRYDDTSQSDGPKLAKFTTPAPATINPDDGPAPLLTKEELAMLLGAPLGEPPAGLGDEDDEGL